jgi:FMN phosphatase YigB (HAD superfamily)
MAQIVTQKAFQAALPLYERVIFIDWHGVLSTDLFWKSILGNPQHPHYQRLTERSSAMFQNDRKFVRQWMRGEVSSACAVEKLGILRHERLHRTLINALHRDCRSMSANSDLLTMLQPFRNRCFLVLATDNADCFESNVSHLEVVMQSVDFVLCSSALGVLKSDSVDRFFGPWLHAHRMSFQNAFLIDDSLRTCRAFASQGGSAFRFRTSRGLNESVKDWMRRKRETGMPTACHERETDEVLDFFVNGSKTVNKRA